MKTDQLISSVNQMIGFFMKCNTSQKWVPPCIELAKLLKITARFDNATIPDP